MKVECNVSSLNAELVAVKEVEGKNPIVMARLGSDPNNPTVTIYGHYDVVAASSEDGWDSDPFTLSGRDGYLYGRGATGLFFNVEVFLLILAFR